MDEIKVLAEKYKKLSPQLFNSEIFFEQILQVETDVGTDFAKRVEQVVLLFLRYILNSKFVLRRSDLLASAIKFNRWQNIPLILTEFEGGFSKSGANVAQTALDQSRLLCLIQIYLNHLPLIYERKGATVSVFRRLFRRMKKSMFDSSHGPFSGNSVTCVPPVQLFAYGQNSALTLGIPFGEKTHHPTPVSFNCNITSLKKISYGGSHTLFLSDEDLYVCGTGQCGKLGTGNEKDCVEPLYVRGDIIDIAAGPKHSVVCTKTKILVCGRNDHHQLGIKCSKEKNITELTEAHMLKDKMDEITNCYTCSNYTVVVTKLMAILVAGSHMPWLNESAEIFTACPELKRFLHNQRQVHFYKSCVVSTRNYGQTSVISLQRNPCDSPFSFNFKYNVRFITLLESLTPQCPVMFYKRTRTLFETGNLDEYCISLVSSPSATAVLTFVENLSVIDQNMTECGTMVDVDDIVVAETGEFMLVDGDGLLYEGDLRKCLSRCKFSSDSEAHLDCSLIRVRGIYPVHRAFISPNGCDRAFLAMSPNLSLFLDQLLPFSSSALVRSKKEKGMSDSRMVDVVGLRDGEAVEVFRMSTYRDWLRKESDYCDTFFKTWSVTKRKRNPVVKFFAEADVLEIFIHFCQWKELPLDFDKECLVDSLIFADRYLCDNFFNILLEKWFRLPFLLRSVADWYSFARHLSNVKIYRFISQVTASLFPIMLETCLVEQLSDQEMAMVEAAYMDLPNIFSEPFSDGYENAKKTFTDANDEITKLENVFEMGCSLAETTYQKKQDSSKISPVSSCSDVFVLLSNVASILRELSDEEVLSICQYIRSSKTRSNMVPHRHVKKNSITKDDQTGVEPTTLPKNEVTDISVFGKLLSSGPTHPAYPQPSPVKHSISVEATLNNLAMSSPAADSEQTRSTFWSAINSVSSPCVSEEPSSRVPLESPSTVTRGTKPWGDVQRLQCSFMEILHEEQALKESSSQEGASPCHTPSKHLSWIMADGIRDKNANLSFTEIMNEEIASQHEATRLRTSSFTDVELEEQAISELMSAYEQEGLHDGVSMTITVERTHGILSDPLWAARG